ncbi:MAG: S9 family peptidase, partial [Prevotella sp.]|nr:S9 family peptidase [Prevotella sp.]
MISQDKQFTLEDLNFGGNNYRNMTPKNKFYTWWGDELIRQDSEECFIVDKKTGKEKVLLKLEDVNKWTKEVGETRPVRNLYYATFPYPTKSLARVSNGHSYMLVDFKLKKVAWTDSISTTNDRDWTAASKATAYKKNDTNGNSQLFI